MAKKHLKRLTAPRTWNIERKTDTFIMRPLPGAHTMEQGMPLTMMLQAVHAAKTAREIRYLLNVKQVLVDGKRRKGPKHMIGLLDVLSLPELQQHYRIILDAHGYLAPVPIQEKEANLKLTKIVGKKMLAKGIMQLNLADGRNILSKDSSYTVGDVLLITIPDQQIKQHLRLEKGSLICLTGGKHRGALGTVKDVEKQTVTFTTHEGTFVTPAKYTLVVGKEKPLITIGEPQS